MILSWKSNRCCSTDFVVLGFLMLIYMKTINCRKMLIWLWWAVVERTDDLREAWDKCLKSLLLLTTGQTVDLCFSWIWFLALWQASHHRFWYCGKNITKKVLQPLLKHLSSPSLGLNWSLAPLLPALAVCFPCFHKPGSVAPVLPVRCPIPPRLGCWACRLVATPAFLPGVLCCSALVAVAAAVTPSRSPSRDVPVPLASPVGLAHLGGVPALAWPKSSWEWRAGVSLYVCSVSFPFVFPQAALQLLRLCFFPRSISCVSLRLCWQLPLLTVVTRGAGSSSGEAGAGVGCCRQPACRRHGAAAASCRVSPCSPCCWSSARYGQSSWTR